MQRNKKKKDWKNDEIMQEKNTQTNKGKTKKKKKNLQKQTKNKRRKERKKETDRIINRKKGRCVL